MPNGIADASRPNAGRIYDYLLGGSHNFEVDRKAAQKLLEVAPSLPQISRLVRWFLREAVWRLSDAGFRTFIDLASGLPTVDHIHETAGPDARVVYSDIDPVTVEYGRRIIGDNPNVVYEQCDAATPEELLERDNVKRLVGEDRTVVFGMNGIAYFLRDDQLEHSFRVLYDWAAPGSRVYLSDANASPDNEQGQKLKRLYENMGQQMHTRIQERMKELIGNWQIEEPGFQFLEDWVDLEAIYSREFIEVYKGGGFYGGILRKP